HHVAVVPEAVPVPLLDFLLVKLYAILKLVFEGSLKRIGPVRQAPDAEDRHRVKILGCANQQSRLTAQLSLLNHVLFERNVCTREQHQLTGASYSLRSAETRLHVLVAGVQVVGVGAAVTQVHWRSIRRRQPSLQFGRIAGRILNLERCWVRLPEVSDRYTEAARDVANEDQARSAPPSACIQPATLRVRSFLNFEPVGCGLDQLE